MRKLAVTVSAVALMMGASLGAQAQDGQRGHTITNIAPGINVTIGGDFNAYGGIIDDNVRRDSSSDLLGDGRLDIRASGQEGNISYGAAMQAYADTSRDLSLDRAWLWVGTPFATIHFGDNDGVNTLMRVGTPHLGRGTLNSSDAGRSSYWMRFAGETPLLADRVGTGTSTKISIISDSFYGFRIGASYTPTLDHGSNIKFGRQDSKDFIEISGRYDGETNMISYHIGGGFITGKVAGHTDETWNIGGGVGFGDFAFGAGFTHNERNNVKSEEYSVGATYAWQDFTFGANYAYTKEGGIDKDTISFGATYDITQNLAIHSDLGFINRSGNNNNATVFTTGLRVHF